MQNRNRRRIVLKEETPKGGGHMSTYHSHETHRSHARWIVAAAVVLAIIVAIVLVVVYAGGGGSGGGY